MSFSTHTFEINPDGHSRGFAFHQQIGEGQDLYFLGKFSDDAVNPREIAEILFGEVVDACKASKAKDSYEKFEEALKAANLAGSRHRKNIGKTPDIIVAYFDFHNLLLTQSGDSEAYLLRGGTVSQISEATENSGDLFLNILSGQVAIDDTVVISTNRILRSVTTTQLSETFERSDFDESCSILRHSLMTNAEEDVLVTVIGIGKKQAVGTAGFLSKMVSKVSKTGEKLAEAAADKLSKTDDVEPESDIEPEDIEDEPAAAAFTGTVDKMTDEFVGQEEPILNAGKLSSVMSMFTPAKLKVLAGAVLALAVLVIGIRAITNYESEATTELRAELQQAREAIQQADTFLVQGDRKQASELLDAAQLSAQKVLNSKSSNFRFDAQTILADIQEKQLAVENARKVDPQVLADLGIKNDNVVASGLLGLRGGLYAYDTKNYYKTVRNIVETGVRVSEKESIVAASSRPDQSTLVFLTDGPRIIEARNGVVSPMSTADESWKTGIDIKTFGAKFAYILDPVENQIWKYQRRSSSYSTGSAYSQGADLSRAVSFAIDGSIYILSDDGTIQKLFRGEPQEYGFRDMPATGLAGKNLKLYTDENLDFLYVLDPNNTRIMIFDKGDRFATYRKQIIFDKISDAVDLIVDESGQKANIVTKDKIYEFTL